MTTIKDRLFISMESDMRRGTVRFDNWYLPAKVRVSQLAPLGDCATFVPA